MRLASIALLLYAPIAFGAGTKQPEILVGAAASLTDALTEVGAEYSNADAKHARVRFDFGASSTLAHQITNHAPIDAFISADEANLDSLEQKGLIAAGSRRDVLANELILIANTKIADQIHTPADLQMPSVKHVAICAPEVPVGHYAMELLTKLALATALSGKVVHPDNVRAALALVEQGAADAAFVYASDALILKKAKVVYRAGKTIVIRYPAAMIKDSHATNEALAFLAYLGSPEAKRIFVRHGFLTP